MTARWILTLVCAATVPLGAHGYTIGGVVVDGRTHKVLTNVWVTVTSPVIRDQRLGQTTKGDGRFAFAVEQDGKYSITIRKPGYPPQNYKQAGFDGVSSAIIVREGLDNSNIVFEAYRAGVISGQVKDEDSEPVGNALVTLLESIVTDGERKIVTRGQMRADSNGEYRFSNLRPGTYYVCAMGRPWFADALLNPARIASLVAKGRRAGSPEAAESSAEEPEQDRREYSPDPNVRGTAFLTTFYPRAQTAEEATPIRLEAGGTAQAPVILPLAPAFAIKVTATPSGQFGDGRAGLYKVVSNQRISFLEETVGSDGKFEFDNVPAGSYEISAASPAGSTGSGWHVRQPVEVGAADIEINLRPQPMGGLSGHVRFEGERPEPGTSLLVGLRNEKGAIHSSEVSADGEFSFNNLPAGRYEVTAGNLGFVAAYLVDATGHRLTLELNIAPGEVISRDLAVTHATAVVTGTAEQAGNPLVGAFVLLLPKDLTRRWAYKRDQTDSDGSYHMGAVPPGDYFLIAVNNGEGIAYREPKVAAGIVRAAKPVHVEAGDKLDFKVEVQDTKSLGLPSM